MSRLHHFFVLYRPNPDPPWALEEYRRRLPSGWTMRATTRFLIGWQNELPTNQDAFLLHQGDLAPDASPAFARDLASGTPSVAARLDGTFALLACDPTSDRLALVTDRFGLMPIYHHAQENLLGYATSMTLLARLMRPHVSADPAAVNEMLVVQMALGNRTLVREISLVPPASVVTFGPYAPSAIAYWSWRGLSASPHQVTGDVVRQTYEVIESAVLAAVPPGTRKVAVPLSGGLDSRLLCAILARHQVPVLAYNIDFGDEAGIARQVADVLKLPLRSLQLLDRPAMIPEAHAAVDGDYHVNQVWGWDMARVAAEEDGCEVLFDGLAFDTILGSVHHVGGNDVQALAENLLANYADVTETILERGMGGPTTREGFAVVRQSLTDLARLALDEAGPLASDQFLMTNRIRKYTFGYCLANLHQVPGRFPYVTTRLFEHCLRLPLALRLDHDLYRRIYREVFPDLARIPWAKTGLPLDRYGSPHVSRWWLYLEALVRRLSFGWFSLSSKGSFDHEFRRRQALREVYLHVLDAATPELSGVLPLDLPERVVRQHLAGRDLGGLLQGLYTVKHCLALVREAASTQGGVLP